MNSCSTPCDASTVVPLSGATTQRPDGRLAALVQLLGDESSFVWERVRPELAREGRRAARLLRREARSSDARARGRARLLLAELERRDVLRRLVGYATRETIDLETALLLLARYGAPALDPRPVQRALDSMAAELVERGRRTQDELERVRLVPRYLGLELGFGGNKGEFHSPDNIHLHRVIERRAGMPLSLCAIYLFVARRMGMKGGILPLPGHVMVRLWAGPTGIIFDPYHKGQERTERDCKRYVEQNRMRWDPAMLKEASDRGMFKRQILNLTRSAEKRGHRREIEDMALVLHALEARTIAKLPARGAGPTRGTRS